MPAVAPLGFVTVVIPARNEEAALDACLRSVETAVDVALRAHPEVSVRVVLVLDRCTDDSARIAARFTRVTQLALDAGTVGAARAHGIAAAELGVDASSAHWIANTDADSVVPPHWLIAQLGHALAGADAWVGTVTPVLADLDDARRDEWLRTHPPGASRGHVHGANLGFSASAYRDVGGFEHLPEHEDVRLVDRLARAGAVIAATDEAPVLTSARLVGRTPSGYAGYLTRLAPSAPRWESPDAVTTA